MLLDYSGCLQDDASPSKVMLITANLEPLRYFFLMTASICEEQLSLDVFCDILRSIVPNLPAACPEALHPHHQLRVLSPGEYLMQQGHTCNGFFILSVGRVRLSLPREASNPAVDLHDVAAPAAIGLLGCILGNTFLVNARALTNTTAIFLPKSPFFGLLQEQPMASLAFSSVLAQELNQAYRQLQELRARRD